MAFAPECRPPPWERIGAANSLPSRCPDTFTRTDLGSRLHEGTTISRRTLTSVGFLCKQVVITSEFGLGSNFDLSLQRVARLNLILVFSPFCGNKKNKLICGRILISRISHLPTILQERPPSSSPTHLFTSKSSNGSKWKKRARRPPTLNRLA